MPANNDIRKQQEEFARREMSADSRAAQSAHDRAEFKVKLILNAALVKGNSGWITFEGARGDPVAGWDKASCYIRDGLREQAQQHKGGA